MSIVLHLGQHFAGERVDLHDALDLVAEELDAQRHAPRRPAVSPGYRRGCGTCRG